MRWFQLLLWPAGAVLGIAAEWISFGWGDPRQWVPDLVTGWTLIAYGLVAWSRRRSRAASHSGDRLQLVLGELATSGVAPFDWVGAHALYVYRGPLIHLLVAYPRGRLSSRLDRAAVAVGYAAAVVTPVWRSEIATIVLASFWSQSALSPIVAQLFPCAGRAVGPARCCGRRPRVRRWCGGSPCRAGRRRGRPSLLRSRRHSARSPLGFSPGCSHLRGSGRLSPTSWSSSASRSGTLRDELARSLGDPSLAVGYWLPNDGAFVDSEGHRLALPDRGSERSVTMIEGEGGRSLRSSTTWLYSTIRASGRRSQPRPGSRPRMRVSRPRCAARSRSFERRGGGSSR